MIGTLPLLQVGNVHTHFHTWDGVVKAFDGISFDLREGEALCVVGELDSGKSVGRQSGEAVELHLKMAADQAKKRTIEPLEMAGIPSAQDRIDDYPHTANSSAAHLATTPSQDCTGLRAGQLNGPGYRGLPLRGSDCRVYSSCLFPGYGCPSATGADPPSR